MRIALITHSVVRGDGQGRVNYEIARHCLGQGVDVTLVADRVAPQLLDLGACWEPVHPRPGRPNLLKAWSFAARADRVVERLRSEVDVIVANGFVVRRPHDVNISNFVHAAWYRSPQHTGRVHGGLYGLYQRAYTRMNMVWESAAYGAATTVVAVSAKLRRDLVSIGVEERRIRVILNGVDTDEFHPGQQDRVALGLPAGVPIALFAGDIRTPLKNLPGVLQALTQVPGLHLAVCGEARRSPYPQLARQLGLGDRVHFIGFRRDLPAVMRACDLLVFPSRCDAFGLVVLEAMASGLPVITALSAGASEVVGDDSGFVLQNPDDVPALAAHLRVFSDDADLRRRMGRAARAAAEQHTWARMAGQYLQLFKRVVAREAACADTAAAGALPAGGSR